MPLVTEQDLDELFALHGAQRQQGPDTTWDGPKDSDAEAVAKAALEHPDMLAHLQKELRARGAEALTDRTYPLPSALGALTSGSVPDDAGWSRKRTAQWRAFLNGGWLERFVAASLRRAAPGTSVETNLRMQRRGREFEVDVAAAHGGTLYLVSCTVDEKIMTAKHKAFEVAHRARQLGGDLARAALVTWMHGVDTNTDTTKVASVQTDVDELWGAPARVLVRGREHLAAWLAGDVEDLRAWLAAQPHPASAADTAPISAGEPSHRTGLSYG